MPIQALIVNNRGLYSQNRASQMPAASVASETAANNELRALHEPLDSLKSQQPDF
jgi:hypothetical protein